MKHFLSAPDFVLSVVSYAKEIDKNKQRTIDEQDRIAQRTRLLNVTRKTATTATTQGDVQKHNINKRKEDKNLT